MATPTKPRSGSLQFWPRVRAKRMQARIRQWADSSSKGVVGFAGYKAGMTHLSVIDKEKGMTNGEKITVPATIIECPAIKPISIRVYKQNYRGLQVIDEIPAKKLDKELSRRLILPKKEKKVEDPKNFDELRLLVYTQPKLTGIGKKKPEVFELGINGDLEYAKSLLEKEITLEDVFKPGQYVDTHSITTGKGFQGVVKRFGVTLKSHKSEKKRRSIGNLGPFTPRRVSFKVPQTGQMGCHTRTEYNKLILGMGNNPEDVNQSGGIRGYGVVKGNYLLIKGSIPGPKKRLIKFTKSIRGTKDISEQDIRRISTSSKR
jgi:large subunit ribosomal protein L3